MAELPSSLFTFHFAGHRNHCDTSPQVPDNQSPTVNLTEHADAVFPLQDHPLTAPLPSFQLVPRFMESPEPLPIPDPTTRYHTPSAHPDVWAAADAFLTELAATGSTSEGAPSTLALTEEPTAHITYAEASLDLQPEPVPTEPATSDEQSDQARPDDLPPPTFLDDGNVREGLDIISVADAFPLAFALLAANDEHPPTHAYRVYYRYRFPGSRAIFRHSTTITAETAALLTWLHHLHPTYPIYYFWKDQDFVSPRAGIRNVVDSYKAAQGHIDIARTRTPHHGRPHRDIYWSSEHFGLPSIPNDFERDVERSAEYDVPWFEYSHRLGTGTLDELNFSVEVVFFPQHPVLRLFQEAPVWASHVISRQLLAEFGEDDEATNARTFETLTPVQRLAFILFVVPPACFLRYRATGRLNVFGAHLPEYSHPDSIYSYRPIPMHLFTYPAGHAAIIPPIRV
ncbi:hypothetical protein LXA43DRAFT_1069519 [Ganoderma leucocontextum]|nr:hypothetical protein LXA43DRAFT_1069519 [Ganoderma leucocontextum]